MRSSLEGILCGVLQGSILSHKLFSLCLNSTCNVSSILKIALFADDTRIVYIHDSTTSLCKIINAELAKLCVCFDLSKLSHKLHKTDYII